MQLEYASVLAWNWSKATLTPALHTITAYLLKLWSDHSQVRDEDFYPDPESLLKIETLANGSEIDALVEADS